MNNSTHDVVVETLALTKDYGEFRALDNLSITVRRGQILGFIGPNGAGKTTTIKILVGLARPTGGTAKISGVDCVSESRKIKRLVGYMPDKFGSYDNMRVHEYLDFFGAAFGIPARTRRTRIEEVLHTTGAAYMRDRFVESLSHGMQKKVGIARTLLHDPEVLIFDEPASGLDPQARIELRQILLRLAEMGKSLIVTSHILPELSRICDQVAIITQGKLRAFGSLEEIMRSVNQRRTIEVQLADPSQLAAAADVVRRVAGDELTAGELVVSETESLLRFTTTRNEQHLATVLAHLVQAGVSVSQFRELQTDLEDAFLSVTRSYADIVASPAPVATQ